MKLPRIFKKKPKGRKAVTRRLHIYSRYILISIVILFVSGLCVLFLLNTTVIHADEWNAKGDRTLSDSILIKPLRGEILAADGSILATNLNYYNVRIDFHASRINELKYLESIDSLADTLARYYPQRDRDEWYKHLHAPMKIAKKDRSRSYLLLKHIPFDEMQRVKKFPYFRRHPNPNRTGFTTERVLLRRYPYGDMARLSIGRVGETKTNPEVRGISGLEQALDTMLYGESGVAKKVMFTRGTSYWTEKPPRNGTTIRTTIDVTIQDLLEHELGEMLLACKGEWGSAMIMEVATGDIKAISNLELNPNGPGYIEARNRAVMGYEPGSVIKTLSMMIAVEDGIITDFDQMLPTGLGWAYAGGRPITDSHHSTAIRAGDVIEQSSNIGMARIITSKYDSHPGGFYARVKSLGFLEPLNTGIAGEVIPRIDSVPSDRGGRIALSRQCYGYATEIPPLYTLALYNAIANDGVFVRPRLVKELRGSVDSVLEPSYLGNGRACSPKTAEIMRGMLTNVVWGDHGTGRFLRNNVVRIAGKTGTCYMIENGQYNTGKKRLAFCGFFPAEAPQYSCVVLTCHPTKNFFGAATTSGQVMRNIAMKLYARGMLGNSSDYESASPSDVGPTFYASTSPTDPYKRLRSPFSLPNSKTIKGPSADASSGVPDVRGLSARDAVVKLESLGYDVTLSGSGFVHVQTPAPRTHVDPGHTVHLTLSR